MIPRLFESSRPSARRLLPLAASLVFLTGCATQATRGDLATTADDPALAALAAAGVSPVSGLAAGPMRIDTEPEDEDSIAEPTIIRGNDTMFRQPPPQPPVALREGEVSLSFEQAPVTEVAHAILGDVLQVPYVINQPVSGELTIHTHTPLPRDQLFSVFESVLQANGLTVVRDSAGVYHVGRPETLRGVAPALGRVKGLAPGQALVVIPLQFIGASEMADILGPLAPAEAFVRVDTFRNLLMLAGSRNQLEGWMDVVETFDIDVLKGMSVGLFPLQYASVREVEVAVGALFAGSTAAAGGAGARPVGGGNGEPAPATELSLGGPLGGLVRIIAIERLNALLVVSPRAYFIDQAREWIARFDVPRESGLEPSIFVYPVQNGTAAHLAGLLSALFGGDFAGVAAPTRTDPGVAPGLRSGASRTAATTASASATTASTVGAMTSGTEAPQPITQFELGPQVRVVADEYNNALLIHAPRSEYRKIEAALRQLDKSPTQVLIEASIIEVTLRDELEYGLQWFFQGGIGSGYAGQGSLRAADGFNPYVPRGVGAPAEGFSYSVLSSAGQIRAVLNMLARNSLLNVISSPSVMVLDNHTATIQVGDQQPIRSATSLTDGGVSTTSIQYRDTGVLLSVTPSVNAGGMVSMTIEQEVTDVGEIDTATEQRTFMQRRIGSRVAVRSGETVVLGGLIRDNNVRGRSGVPVLHEVPLFGNLFGSTRNQQVRTELLIMLTPRVMQGDAELRQVGSEMRQRMRGLQSLVDGERGSVLR